MKVALKDSEAAMELKPLDAASVTNPVGHKVDAKEDVGGPPISMGVSITPMPIDIGVSVSTMVLAGGLAFGPLIWLTMRRMAQQRESEDAPSKADCLLLVDGVGTKEVENLKASRSTGGAMRGRKASKPAPGAGGCSILWSTSLAVVAEASRAGRGWRPAAGPDSHSGTEWSNWCSFVNFVRPPWSSLSTLGNESNDRSSIPLVRPETRSEGSGSEGSGELLPGAQVVSRCPLRDTVGPAARSARASTLPSHEPDVQTHRKPFGCQVSSRAERLHAQFHVPRMSFA